MAFELLQKTKKSAKMTQKPEFSIFKPNFGQNCTFRTFFGIISNALKRPLPPYSQAIKYENYVILRGCFF